MAKAAKAFVDETLDENPVVIFSKSYCPILQEGQADLRRAWRCSSRRSASAVPPDLEDMNRNNKLKPLLKSHGLLK
ncbi:hypothetical protein MRX96_036657 [Rhipicephalus microplus]